MLHSASIMPCIIHVAVVINVLEEEGVGSVELSMFIMELDDSHM